MTTWRTVVASDVTNDGLGLELYDDNNELCAEVFRRDADHTVTIYHYRELTPEIMAWFIKLAQEELDPFEDGLPLPIPADWLRGAA